MSVYFLLQAGGNHRAPVPLGRERYTAAAAARVFLPLPDLLRHRRARAFLCAVRAGAAWKMEKGPLPASCASPVAGPVSRSNASTPLSLPVSVPGSLLSRGTRPAPFGREREPLHAAVGRFYSPPVRHPPCRAGSRSRPVAPCRWRVMAATSFCAAAAARYFAAPVPAGTRSAGVGLFARVRLSCCLEEKRPIARRASRSPLPRRCLPSDASTPHGARPGLLRLSEGRHPAAVPAPCSPSPFVAGYVSRAGAFCCVEV